jgi:hypothetical protein
LSHPYDVKLRLWFRGTLAAPSFSSLFNNADISVDYTFSPPGGTYPARIGDYTARAAIHIIPGMSGAVSPPDSTGGVFDIHDFSSKPSAPVWMIDYLFPVSGRTPTLHLQSTLMATVSGATIDLGHTAWFEIFVPEGVTWSSASGAFLSEPIPEPSILAILSAAICAIAVLRLRPGHA